MITTAMFALAVLGQLVFLGRSVWLPYSARPAVAGTEPRAIRDLTNGAAVLNQIGLAYADRIDRYARELQPAR
ncbi:MAG: hypothetical protein GEU98_27675 [Pseudonocardiaceae bacterium]|nr:hypothetical protein [Pseudonocardiaceae bacterium]